MKQPCSIPECLSPAIGRGWCNRHWKRWRAYGDPLALIKPEPILVCTIPGCGKPHDSRGWCAAHWLQWRKHGDPLYVAPSRRPERLAERFWAKVEKTPTCWIWKGQQAWTGYGLCWVGKPVFQKRLAHRIAYELLAGVIPDGMTIDHLCRVRLCVNPAHMEIVSRGENTKRGGNAQKTHCKRGHEFTDSNTYLDRNNHRYCRACFAIRGSMRSR